MFFQNAGNHIMKLHRHLNPEIHHPIFNYLENLKSYQVEISEYNLNDFSGLENINFWISGAVERGRKQVNLTDLPL
jgi:hypothetical protein